MAVQTCVLILRRNLLSPHSGSNISQGIVNQQPAVLKHRNQQIARIDFDYTPAAEAITELEHHFHTYLPKCKFVIFSDYGKGSLCHVQSLILAAKAAGAVVLVDPKGHDYSRYVGADCIKPNLYEMREMVGGWRDEAHLAEKAMALLESTDIASILLTRAADGMSLFSVEEVIHYPSVAKEVYDVTGAGDTAIACLAVALSKGCSWGEAVRYATKAAGLAVTHFGTAVIQEKEVFPCPAT